MEASPEQIYNAVLNKQTKICEEINKLSQTSQNILSESMKRNFQLPPDFLDLCKKSSVFNAEIQKLRKSKAKETAALHKNYTSSIISAEIFYNECCKIMNDLDTLLYNLNCNEHNIRIRDIYKSVTYKP